MSNTHTVATALSLITQLQSVTNTLWHDAWISNKHSTPQTQPASSIQEAKTSSWVVHGPTSWRFLFSRPHIALPIVKDIYFIFCSQISWRAWIDFCKTLPHNAVCSVIMFYSGVHVSPKKSEGRETQFLNPKSTLWAYHCIMRGK